MQKSIKRTLFLTSDEAEFASNGVARTLKKLPTSKGDCCIKQSFSTITSLFKLGTSLNRNNLLLERILSSMSSSLEYGKSLLIYPTTLKSAGYYVIPSIQKIALECPSVCPSVCLSVCTPVRKRIVFILCWEHFLLHEVTYLVCYYFITHMRRLRNGRYVNGL